MVGSKSRAINLLAMLLIGAVVLIVSLTALGSFDPTADGEPLWQTELGSIQILPDSTEVRPLMEDLPPYPLSVRLSAAHESGETDSAYGLLLGQKNGTVAIMVSPLGYVAIWRGSSDADFETKHYYLPWQTWPHVRTGDRKNEILVYLDGDKMTVRLNREWLWEGDNIDQAEWIGIVGESYGAETSLDFHLAEISAVEAGN